MCKKLKAVAVNNMCIDHYGGLVILIEGLREYQDLLQPSARFYDGQYRPLFFSKQIIFLYSSFNNLTIHF